jgi:hypothetical protein
MKKKLSIEKVMKGVKEKKTMWKNDDNDVLCQHYYKHMSPFYYVIYSTLNGNGSIGWWNLLFYKNIY